MCRLAHLKKANGPNISIAHQNLSVVHTIAEGFVENLNRNLLSDRCTLGKGFWWKSEIKSWAGQAEKSGAMGGDYWSPTT